MRRNHEIKRCASYSKKDGCSGEQERANGTQNRMRMYGEKHAKRAGTERASRKIKQVDTNHALQIMWCMDMAGRASILSCLWTTDEVVREIK